MAGVAAMGQWAALLASVLLLASAATSAEAEFPIPARLEMEGSACGGAESLRSRIALRTQRVRFVAEGYAVSIGVRIDAGEQGYVATLALRSHDGTLGQKRRIETPLDCDDTLDALALVVAVGLDQWELPPVGPEPPPEAPSHRTRRPGRIPVGPRRTSPAPPGFQRSVPLPLSPLESAFPSRAWLAPARSVSLGRRPVSVPPRTKSRWISWGLAAGPRVLGGVAPGAMPGGRAALLLALAEPPATLSVFRPEISLAISHFWRNGAPTRGEEQLDFALTSVGVALCPFRFGSEAFGVRPCASLETGRLRSTGRRTFGPIAQVRGFRSAGLTLDGLWSFGSVQAGATVRGAFAGPPDRFTFGDPTEGDVPAAHEIRPWVWEAGLVFGWRLL